MATGNSTRRVVTYPEWQLQYEAALLELDSSSLPERIRVAEAAILRCLQAVSSSGDDSAEKDALENALGALLVLTREARR